MLSSNSMRDRLFRIITDEQEHATIYIYIKVVNCEAGLTARFAIFKSCYEYDLTTLVDLLTLIRKVFIDCPAF